MRRRDFLGAIAGVAGWPLAAQAQQRASPAIGYFSGRSPDAEEQYKIAFLQGLKDAGFVADQDVTVEYLFSHGHDDQLPAIAADLIHRQAAVIVATDAPSALAAKKATATIPIVFSAGGDPVKLGLVASLNRPGGNATGVSVFVTELGPKRLQFIREIVPGARLIAHIVNLASETGPPQVSVMEAAAKAMGQQILTLSATTEGEIDTAFAALVRQKADAIVYGASVFFQVNRQKLVDLAALHAIPAIYEWPEFVHSGGLISYSSTRSEPGRQMGNYAGQILKGAKPADLPVMQSSKFELAINLKTAKAVGVTIPPSLLVTADVVIE